MVFVVCLIIIIIIIYSIFFCFVARGVAQSEKGQCGLTGEQKMSRALRVGVCYEFLAADVGAVDRRTNTVTHWRHPRFGSEHRRWGGGVVRGAFGI